MKMYFSPQVQAFEQALRESPDFTDCYIIKAYPDAKLPTRFNKAVIALSQNGATATAAALGQNHFIGTYELKAGIYSPYGLGAEKIYDLTQKLLAVASGFSVQGFSVSGIAAEEKLRCCTAEVCITFCGAIQIKEEDGNG